MWEYIFDRYEFSNPIGECIKLDGLTENQKELKRMEYVNKLQNAVQMLQAVRETVVIEHAPVDERGKICSCGKRQYVCNRCGKVLCYSHRPDFGWCPDCMSCGEGEHEWGMANPPVVCVKCGVEHPYEQYWVKHRKESK